jgi:hypothetical protein
LYVDLSQKKNKKMKKTKKNEKGKEEMDVTRTCYFSELKKAITFYRKIKKNVKSVSVDSYDLFLRDLKVL